MQNKRIVIWGDDHHNALGLLRMLGDRGFDILFLVNGCVKNIATASKYCQKYVTTNSINAGLDYLLKNYNDKENKAILLFTADRYAEAANNNLDRLKDFFIVSGPSQQCLLSEIDDKYSMGIMAADCGINIPSTFLYSEDALSEINSFPVIIKPCSPSEKDFKTKVIKSRSQLFSVSKTLSKNKRYVIQQYISKIADGLIYGCRKNDGEIELAGICVRNRWGEDGCGSFGYITPDIPKSISREGIAKFLERIGFKGLFSVEYAITQDTAFFYEFNLRNDGTSVLFYNAGANIALSYVNSCFGIDEGVPVIVRGKQYLMHEILDRFNIYDGIVSRKQWLADKAKVTLHFLYDSEDIRPYEMQKSLEMKTFLHHALSRSCINKIRLKIKTKLIGK